MRKSIILAAFAFAALVSCTKEFAPVEKIQATVTPEGYVPVTLTAQVDPETKATIDGNFIMWAVGDSVAVFADGAGEPLKFIVSEIMGNDTVEAVKFGGNVPEGTTSYICAYPYRSDITCVEGQVTLSIPSEQVVPANGNIDPAAMPSVAYYPQVTSSASFRNVMSLLKFNVGKNEGVTEVTITSESPVFAGKIVAKVVEESAPELTSQCDLPVVVKSAEGFLPETDYYAVVAPCSDVKGLMAGALQGVKLGVRTTENAVSVTRNNGLNLGDVTGAVTWRYRYIKTGEDLAGFLAEADTYSAGWEVAVLNDIDCSGVELVPATSYAGIFDGQGYSIKNWTSNGIPLFVTNTGTVKNFTVDASCKLNLPETISGNIAFVVCNNKGVVSGITNNADIIGDVTIGGGYAAAIVGRCDATGLGHGITVADCVNNGNITLNTTANTAGTQYVGTIMGSMGANEENVITDCINNGDLTINCSGTNTKNFYIGGITGGTTNNSNNVNLINNGDVTLNCAGHEAALCLAGISSYTTGNITNCENNGNISFLSEGRLKATFVAGLAGYYADRTVSNSVNRGDITISATAIGGRNNIGGMDGTKSYNGTNGISAGLTIGGLVSATGYNNPTFESCSNYGKVTLTLTDPMGNPGSHTAARPSMGGLVGDCAGPMTDCHNYGDVSVTFGTADFTATNAGYTPYVGGLVGSSYNFSGATISGGSDKNARNKFTLTDCSNSGNVTLVNYNKHTTNNAVGGICGWPQSEDKTAVYVAKNCSNSGNISGIGNAKIRVGGIHGGTGRMDGCTNTGNVYIEAAQPESVAGSIAGFHSQAHTFSNCTAGGTVTANCTVAGLGGLVGQLGNVTFNAMDGCSVDCELIGGPENATGLIVGKFNGTSNPIVLGTEDDPIEVAGKIDGTAVTAETIKTYFCGSNGMNIPVHDVFYSFEGQNYRAAYFVENLEGESFIYEGKKYAIKKLADGRWWMAAPLAYIPKGKTVSADPVEDAGIWYTYTTDGTTTTALTDFNDGYLYDYPTAFGVAQDAITYGTRDEFQAGTNVGNFRDFEGTQGICPPGWYIPTRADFLKIVGASNKDDSITPPETAAVEDATAAYWVADYKGSSIPVFNEAGWNFSFLGVRSKTSTAQTGAYNKTATKDGTCSVAEWVGKPALNQVMCSTPYMPNVAGNNVQYFCLMSAFTATNNLGKLSLSYGNYLHGMEVRCIRKQAE